MKPLSKLLTNFIPILLLLLIPAGCARPREIEIRSIEPPTTRGEIYIGGNVTSPGYYPLRDGDTIPLLLQSAGGTISDAGATEIELYVSQPKNEPQRIDINRAELWLFEAVPGIGETLAKRIIDYRNRNGNFRSVDELTRVEGIGTATLEKIKDLITVSD